MVNVSVSKYLSTFYLQVSGAQHTVSLSICFTGIRSVDSRFELNQSQINVAAQEQTSSKK